MSREANRQIKTASSGYATVSKLPPIKASMFDADLEGNPFVMPPDSKVRD
jgi:hypothetical protein